MDSIQKASDEVIETMYVGSSMSEQSLQPLPSRNSSNQRLHAELIVHNAISTAKKVYSQDSVAMADKQQRQRKKGQQSQRPKEVEAKVNNEQRATVNPPSADKQRQNGSPPQPTRKQSPVRFHRGFGFDDQTKYCLYCLKPIDPLGGHTHGTGHSSAASSRQRAKTSSSPPPSKKISSLISQQQKQQQQQQQYVCGKQRSAMDLPAEGTGKLQMGLGKTSPPADYGCSCIDSGTVQRHTSPSPRTESLISQREGFKPSSPPASSQKQEKEEKEEEGRPASLIPHPGSRALSPQQQQQQQRPLAVRRQQETVLQRAQRLLREAEQSLFCELFCPCECLGDVIDPIRHYAAANVKVDSDTAVKTVHQDGDRQQQQQQRRRCGPGVENGAGVKVTGGGAGGRSLKQRQEGLADKTSNAGKKATSASSLSSASSGSNSTTPASLASAAEFSSSSSSLETAPSVDAQAAKSSRAQPPGAAEASSGKGKTRPLTDGHREGREAAMEARKGNLIRITDFNTTPSAVAIETVTEAECYLCQAEKQQQQVNCSACNNVTSSPVLTSPVPDDVSLTFSVKEVELNKVILRETCTLQQQLQQQEESCVKEDVGCDHHQCLCTSVTSSDDAEPELEFCCGADSAAVVCNCSNIVFTSGQMLQLHLPVSHNDTNEDDGGVWSNTNVNNGISRKRSDASQTKGLPKTRQQDQGLGVFCERHRTLGQDQGSNQGQDQFKVAKTDLIYRTDDTSRADGNQMQRSSQGRGHDHFISNSYNSSRWSNSKMAASDDEDAKWVVWIELSGEETLRYHKWRPEEKGEEGKCIDKVVRQVTVERSPTQLCRCRQLVNSVFHGISRVTGDEHDMWLPKTHCAADRTHSSDFCLTHI